MNRLVFARRFAFLEIAITVNLNKRVVIRIVGTRNFLLLGCAFCGTINSSLVSINSPFLWGI